MATMYENFCGNSVDGVELTFHKRVLDFFIPLHINLLIFKIAVNSILPTQLPHKFSYIVAILTYNHFESPNILIVFDLSKMTKG
jgi:hypothetical protein